MNKGKLLLILLALLLGFAMVYPQNSKSLSEIRVGEGSQVFLRVFKYEEQLELWSKPKGASKFQKTHTFPICAASGKLGPKRQQGDGQVPEGFYRISFFNPNSRYHLSMRINYPNQSDKIRTTNPKNPGGDIMIHGNCVSIGCIAIQDEPIEVLYKIAQTAHKSGQSHLPVHIFPCKMNTLRYKIKRFLEKDETLLSFWDELKPGFNHFEQNKKVPNIEINSKGAYYVK